MQPSCRVMSLIIMNAYYNMDLGEKRLIFFLIALYNK